MWAFIVDQEEEMGRFQAGLLLPFWSAIPSQQLQDPGFDKVF